jgi:hypothetical protein
MKMESPESSIGQWEERWSRGDEIAWNIAAIYAGLDEREQALDWLEKAYEEQYPLLLHINVDPQLDDLRSEPRFQALLRKMELY